MSYEQKDNSGSLFKNDRRQNDKQPEYSGNVLIDGREYWISAWVRDGKRGKFFSLAFRPKDANQNRPAPAPKPIERGGSYAEELDDEIPFGPEWR